MQELVVYTDATGTPEAESLALPEPEVTDELRALGWSRMGWLRVESSISTLHPRIRDATYAVWGSPDGTTMAECSRVYGVASLELWTLMESGSIVVTRWYDREGGIDHATVSEDPLVVPDPVHGRPSTRVSATRRVTAALNHSPAVGLHGTHIDRGSLTDAVSHHGARTARLTVAAGPPLVLDVAGLAATQRRWFRMFMVVLQSSAQLDRAGFKVGVGLSFVLLGALAVVRTAVITSSGIPHVEFNSALRDVGGALGGLGVGLSTGYILGHTPGSARWISLAFLPGMLVFLAISFEAAALWGIAGAVIGGLIGWGWFRAVPTQWARRPDWQLRGALPPLSGAEILSGHLERPAPNLEA